MTAPNLIGLTGKAGAGKDTFAECLKPRGYVRVAFADALKDSAYAADPYIAIPGKVGTDAYDQVDRLADLVDALGWDRVKRDFPDARRFLQRHGVAMREQIPGCWATIAARKIDAALAAGRHVVVTDVRFPDEAAMIQQRDGLVVRIERPGHVEAGVDASHVSEVNVGQMLADFTVTNDAGLRKVADCAAHLHTVATESRIPA